MLFSEEPDREPGNDGRLKNGREQVGRCRYATGFKNRKGLIHAPSTLLQRIRNALETAKEVKESRLCLPPAPEKGGIYAVFSHEWKGKVYILVQMESIHLRIQVRECIINPGLKTNLHAPRNHRDWTAMSM